MRKNEDYYKLTEEILLLKNYSRNTRYNYLRILKAFILYMNHSVLPPEDKIRNFLLKFENRREQLKQALCAIRFFYRYVLDKPCPFSITKIRKKKRLPTVFSNEEIWKILNTIKNKKHFLMIALLYGSGLRVGEVVNLKIRDLDFENRCIFIREAKGKKDRLTIMPERIVERLRQITSGREMKDCVFISRFGSKYSIRTVQSIFEKAALKAKLGTKGSCHTLRHSFATHLLHDGVDINTLKTLMGHKSIKTTIQYVHITGIQERKIKSPL